MKEILIISGKGGTGKTSITGAFSNFLQKNDVVVDCDVDAADMHILLAPDYKKTFDFLSGKECKVLEDKCSLCGVCIDNCHYNAISLKENAAFIDSIECESCLLCYYLCPDNAIVANEANCGKYYISNTRIDKTLVHAELKPGADNSGKLVSTVRSVAKKVAQEKGSEVILIDGPPGIGCPVIASITGVDFIVLVTEPTVSGFSDLTRIIELIKHFKVKAGCIINKSTINNEIKNKIIDICKGNDVKILGELPYSKKFYKALVEKKSVIEIDLEYMEKFRKMWNLIKKEVLQ